MTYVEKIRAAINEIDAVGPTGNMFTAGERQAHLDRRIRASLGLVIACTPESVRDLLSRLDELRAALEPFVSHNSSEPTVTITVKTEDVTRARAALARGVS